MIVRLKVDCVEDELSGETVEWTLVDEQGRVMFRFGLVGPSHPASKDPTFGLDPGFFGLKRGDVVQLATGSEIGDLSYSLAVSKMQAGAALAGRDRLLREKLLGRAEEEDADV